MNRLILVSCFFISFGALGHEGEDHAKNSKSDERETIKETAPEELIQKINSRYIERVKPIFQKKCLDCHGTGNSLPWYASIPGPKHLILSDIEEAKQHMDMTNDFPFAGHGTTNEDLEALSKAIKEGSMPPLRYKLLHWDSLLTEEAKKTIIEWAEESLNVLKQTSVEKR